LYSFGPAEERYAIGRLSVRIFRTLLHVRSRGGNPVAPGLFARLPRFDVIHCHQRAMLFSSLSAAAGRLSRRRVFVSDLGGGAWDLSAYVPTERWYHGHLHISQYSRRLIDRADDPRHAVILGGVDAEKFAPDPSVPRGDGVLFVGRLLPHKGVIDLVEGVDAGTPLELIGQPYDARYAEDLRAAAAGKRVTFRHDCDDAALVDAYRRARVVVLPSVYEDRYGGRTLVPELLGQTLLEGMACGAPAICTDVASMPEVVEDGVTGFIVPPNDPAALGARVGWLRAHPEEAARMGAAARRRVLAHFTWDRVVDRCLAAYEGRPGAAAGRSAVS
jgi:glycosyltransferase involved in cell wall biosynthesis